ncbi:replication endonuclease [Burkholderia contaminans]|uniref:replication endonuclease n=1 Tax=Burkholderia contaminans TaxID=488447 RepID=UPI001CF423CD|nr:replication endonuclease [Burkholderia contaminans]MCA7919465.1 replication endonuclease [Burkholderia contaminans]UUX37209.1 replication endonuclease [Burkholderia contaminans]
MWVYAYDARDVLAGQAESQRAKKRLPMKWYTRAMREAMRAGQESARNANASHMFDVGAARARIAAFVDEHAPDTLAVRPDAGDYEICMKARRIASDAQLRTIDMRQDHALVVARTMCAAYGVDMPDFEDPAEQLARVRCELWWRRRLRTLHIRALEHSNVRLHYVHYRSEPYASDDAVRRRIAQNRRNADTLAAVTLENELGQRFTIEQLAAKSISNKALKRGELMTRLRGCEDLADAAGFAGVMFTLTCPSRFHAVRQLGARSKFIANKKYDGSSARDGQAYLRTVWARVRAKLKRDGVSFFGIRVAEPHHDSTPHWHGLVFSNDVDRFCTVTQAYGLADAGDERGAQERRVRFERIDKAKGSAVGYVAKYIAKNVDGAHVGDHKTQEGYVVQADMFGDDEITPSQRVETWAALWGIRQFQAFGCAPVGVWRELRRVKEVDLPDAAESPEIFAAWRAAQKTDEHRADWAEYARAMGGVAGEGRRVYIKHTTEHREGRYGIRPVKVPHGVAARGVAHIVDGICAYPVETEIFVPATRFEWRVVSRSGAAASTRTRVNNCTRNGASGTQRVPERAFETPHRPMRTDVLRQ